MEKIGAATAVNIARCFNERPGKHNGYLTAPSCDYGRGCFTLMGRYTCKYKIAGRSVSPIHFLLPDQGLAHQVDQALYLHAELVLIHHRVKLGLADGAGRAEDPVAVGVHAGRADLVGLFPGKLDPELVRPWK